MRRTLLFSTNYTWADREPILFPYSLPKGLTLNIATSPLPPKEFPSVEFGHFKWLCSKFTGVILLSFLQMGEPFKNALAIQ